MSINDFIKECKKLYGDDIEYKVTTKDGVVFKQTKKWSDKYDSVRFDEIQLRQFVGKD